MTCLGFDHRVIRRIHTLGPQGTNCEAAAAAYLAEREVDAEVVLHGSLEQAMEDVLADRASVLLGCVVYPELHRLVFPYLDRLYIADLFLHETWNMVLAAASEEAALATVASHAAPSSLVPPGCSVIKAQSNSEAAGMCAEGRVSACITTRAAAERFRLRELKDFGRVPMGFTIHAHRAA